MKPLLKWPGGKRFLASALTDLTKQLPLRRYFEPFAGGAALYFALEHSASILTDTNSALAELYQVVRDDPDGLLAKLQSFRNTESDYYRIRDYRPRKVVSRAARLYYLTRFSFNGIYRENLRGDFNVPYGYKMQLPVYDREHILSASRLLGSALIKCADFRDAIAAAAKNDLIYFDPPYTVKHNNNGFIKYNKRLFDWADQVELATTAAELARRGSFVVVSNAFHNDILGLYPDFECRIITRHSVIAADTGARSPIVEALLLSRNIQRYAKNEIDQFSPVV